ncbi:hypothetical protein I204_08233 [Kwoniella mangroviensis CBS 8886]|nr:hypothetical protein I204_08233 [Kwoniella mangroviensis CBS 8886]
MMSQRRSLRIFGQGPREGVWMTEGDKLRLRREGKKFMGPTESQDQLKSRLLTGKAHTPEPTHQRYIRPIFSDLSTSHMYDVLLKATSFFNRYYHAETGVQSARWLHDLSLPSSPSLPFEPPIRNASLPLTIIGAHQDSANYLFPHLPAPGADDDMSGSTSILEAFRALANRGYILQRGPVEFH